MIISYSALIYLMSLDLISLRTYFLIMIAIHWSAVLVYLVRKPFTPLREEEASDFNLKVICEQVAMPFEAVIHLFSERVTGIIGRA